MDQKQDCKTQAKQGKAGNLFSRVFPALGIGHQAHRRGRYLWVLAVAAMVLLSASFVLAQAPSGSVGVYYAGQDDAVLRAVRQAEPYLVLVDRIELAQVLVLNDVTLDPPTLREVGRQVLKEDIGLVIFSGRFFPQNMNDLRLLFGVGSFGIARGEMAPRTLSLGEEADPLQRTIAWDSAPALSARTVISNPNLLLPIVETTAGEPVVQRVRGHEQVQVFVVGPWFGDETNTQWLSWPYFDYMVYRLIAEASGTSRIPSFAAYPLSPVPHDTRRVAIASLGIGIFLSAWLVFFMARRYLFLHPERPGALRAVPLPAEPSSSDAWNRVGFHRPLSGFLFLAAVGLLLFIPLLGYRLFFMPRFLVPWPQTLDFWGQVTRWLAVVWVVFDLGVGLAVVRYFAVLRLHAPREGFRYFQFYIWWQLLTGAFQVGLIFFLAAAVFPETALAHLAFYFIACALIQFPGFLRVFGLFFRALQRLDYEQILLAVSIVGMVFFQSVLVLLFRRWEGLPDFDAIVWSVMGLGLGLYLTELTVFAVGLFLYWRMGYRLEPLLLPTFDRRIVGRVLGFGARLMFGALAAPLGTLLFLRFGAPFFPEETWTQGGWTSAFNFTLAYAALDLGLYNALVPALAEAHAQGYTTLIRYYISQAMRYGMWFSLFVLAVLGAVGQYLLARMTGDARSSAAALIVPLLVWGAVQWPAAIAERLLEAAGRPGLKSWLLVGEQALRLGLLVLLVPRFSLVGLFLAYTIPLLLRGALGWMLAGHLVVRPHLYVWQTVVAPAGAALALYVPLNALVAMLEGPSRVTLVVLYLVVMLFAFPFYGWLTALLGGWTDSGLEELHQAVTMSGLAFPFLWLLDTAVRLGAQISPLRGRFSVDLRELAKGEAQSLTLRRAPLE